MCTTAPTPELVRHVHTNKHTNKKKNNLTSDIFILNRQFIHLVTLIMLLQNNTVKPPIKDTPKDEDKPPNKGQAKSTSSCIQWNPSIVAIIGGMKFCPL